MNMVHRMKRTASVALACAFLPTVASVAATSVTAVRTGVLPFQSVSIEKNNTMVIAKGIRRELTAAGFLVAVITESAGALEAVGCGAPEMRTRESCIRAVARELEAKLIVGGSIERIGELIEATVVLYDGTTGGELWSGDYRLQGEIDAFYTQILPTVAADMPKEFEPPDPTPTLVQQPSGAPQSDSQVQVVTVERSEDDADSAVAPGLVVGLSSLFALGGIDEDSDQSPYGFEAFVLYPTSPKSHARLMGGTPLYYNHHVPFDSHGKLPDAYLSLEHEWGFSHFGISIGLLYTYMQYFALELTQHYSSWAETSGDYKAYFEPSHAFNMVFGIRGGKPHAGFIGRLSWPLPYVINDGEPDNIYLEYSAFGVFGGRRVKGGIGVSGMFATRGADYVVDGDSTYFYTDKDEYSSYDNYFDTQVGTFTALVPAAKVAGLITEHLVVNLTLELGGVIVPRPFEGEGWWQPSIGFDVVYSLEALKGANVLDGTF